MRLHQVQQEGSSFSWVTRGSSSSTGTERRLLTAQASRFVLYLFLLKLAINKLNLTYFGLQTYGRGAKLPQIILLGNQQRERRRKEDTNGESTPFALPLTSAYPQMFGTPFGLCAHHITSLLTLRLLHTPSYLTDLCLTTLRTPLTSLLSP